MHDMVPAYRTRQVQVINSITWPRKHAFSNFQMIPADPIYRVSSTAIRAETVQWIVAR